MYQSVVVIERTREGLSNPAAEICEIFNGTNWIEIHYHNGRYVIKDADQNFSKRVSLIGTESYISFYLQLSRQLPEGSVIYRVRNPIYPLNPLLGREIRENFPLAEYRYVLSVLEECGLEGYFVERLTRSILETLSNDPHPILPPEYFNGLAYEGSGRHWASMDLRRFYLKDQFEVLFQSPRFLAVNMISTCNYHCEKCQFHSPKINCDEPWPKPMSLDQYALILEKCKKLKGLTTICPTIGGEALLHPDIVEIVRMTIKAGYLIGFATNASLLTRELGIQLIEAGIGSLGFSVDSTKPDVYNRLQGGDLDVVEKNILAFQEEWIKRRGSFAGTMICVVSDDNKNEIEEYRRKWIERGFSVAFSAQHDVSANFRPFFQDKKWAPPSRTPCNILWNCIYLNGDGNIIPCSVGARGNGFRENFLLLDPEESWRCKTLQIFRDIELNGGNIRYCRECSCWSGLINTWTYENGRLLSRNQCSWMELPPPIIITTPEPAIPEFCQKKLSFFQRLSRWMYNCFSGFKKTLKEQSP